MYRESWRQRILGCSKAKRRKRPAAVRDDRPISGSQWEKRLPEKGRWRQGILSSTQLNLVSPAGFQCSNRCRAANWQPHIVKLDERLLAARIVKMKPKVTIYCTHAVIAASLANSAMHACTGAMQTLVQHTTSC